MLKLTAISALLVGATSVFAQVQEWGQCGGINYSGSTQCQSPWVCTELNPYYYQCLPASSTSTGHTSTTTSTSSSHTSTTTSHTTSTSSHSTTTSSHSTTTSTHSTTTTSTHSTTTSSSITTGTQASTAAGNPYVGYTVYLIPEYVSEVQSAVASITNSASLASLAAQVESIPVFFWMDVAAKVPTLGVYLAAAAALGGNQLVQAVIYDLPDRDCAADASAGEYSIADNGVEYYETYIDNIAAQVNAYPSVRVVFVVEPDGLANLVTNLSVTKCSNAATAYKECIAYAISQLQQPNVYLYLDAGHSGWLGWPANISPAAQLFGQVLAQAGTNQVVRGLATDVSNYNALRGPEDPAQSPNPNYDEELYINALAPLLAQNNYPQHFIVDQSRSGQIGIRTAEGDWCNVLNAGLGIRPTTDTGNTLIDAIVWVKPPGESDGTSNTSSPRYDPHCGQSDAAQPAPEAGTWFQTYFVTLVERANPAL